MRLLLKEPVESLGDPGDEVNVRAGYARNYLLPRRIAVPITEENRREVASARQEWAVRRVQEHEAAKALRDALEGTTLRFERRVKTDSEELYGSVSVQDISRHLAEAGFEIARHRIVMGGPIKQVGETTVSLRLHPEVHFDLPVEVLPVAAGTLGVDPVPSVPEPDADAADPEPSDPDAD